MIVESLARQLDQSKLSSEQEDLEEHKEAQHEDSKHSKELCRAPAYPYRGLGDAEVRLLRIVPGTGTIECLLEQMPLASVRFFYALSYVWGDPTEQETIMLNGQRFHITRNLWEVLHQFRQRPYDLGYPEDYFWVDAICINQDNIEERSYLVSRMMDIYHAGHVIIWLGPIKKSSTEKAVELMFKKAGSMWTEWEPVDNDDNTILAAEFGQDYNAVVIAAINILKRPWFERVWTIQEACFDTSPIMYASRHSVYLEHFIQFFQILAEENKSLYLCSGSARMICLDKIDHLYRSAIMAWDDDPTKTETGKLLVTILRLAGRKNSSDPKDQIYGLLSLLKYFKHENLPEELKPDYRLSHEEVYWNYAVFLFKSLGDLQLLDSTRNELEHVPSWVPDFRYLFLGHKPRCESYVRVSSDKRTLHLRGCKMGTFCNLKKRHVREDVKPCIEAIPAWLPYQCREFDKHILKPAATIREITIEELFNEIVEKAIMIMDRTSKESFYQVYRRLCKSSGGRRPRHAKRKLTPDLLWIEETIADMLIAPWILLNDGTVMSVFRRDADIETGDLVCLLKGAPALSLLRPSGDSYRYLSQCKVRSGQLKDQEFEDEFWTGRDVEDLSLI